jgi:phage gp46-like protein
VATIPYGQKLFTEDEVSRLTGICLEHLRNLARSKHLGSIIRAAEAAGAEAEKWLFTNSELMILNVLCPRCQH